MEPMIRYLLSVMSQTSCLLSRTCKKNGLPDYLENRDSPIEPLQSEPDDKTTFLRSASQLTTQLRMSQCSVHHLCSGPAKYAKLKPEWNWLEPYGELVSILNFTLIPSMYQFSDSFVDILPNIEILDIRLDDSSENGKQLTLPKNLHDLKYLSKFALENFGHSLMHLPEDIGECPNLKDLAFPGSCVANLPGSVEKCETLESITAKNTLLKTLPDSIGSLLSLTYLDLTSTLITVLPKSFSQLKNLKVLALQGEFSNSVFK